MGQWLWELFGIDFQCVPTTLSATPKILNFEISSPTKSLGVTLSRVLREWKKLAPHLLWNPLHAPMIFQGRQVVLVERESGATSIWRHQPNNLSPGKHYWKGNFSMTPSVGRSVFFSVGWSVCHNFLKGREVTPPCSYRSTCQRILFRSQAHRRYKMLSK